MPLLIGGSPELDRNLETLIEVLKDYLSFIAGNEVPKVKTVMFALVYTIQGLPKDEERFGKIRAVLTKENIKKLESTEFIEQLLLLFQKQKEKDFKLVLKETIGGD